MDKGKVDFRIFCRDVYKETKKRIYLWRWTNERY